MHLNLSTPVHRTNTGSFKQLSRRSRVVVQSKLSPDSLLVSALDKVLNQITRIIYDHEAKQRRLKSSGEALDVEVQTPGKKVKFRTSSSSERLVKEPAPGCTASGRGLSQYLSLPLTEYSLLDPKWITRPDPQGAPDVFVLKVPLNQLLHVDLQPQVTIRVDVDTQNCQVKFYATQFMVGDARFDTNFALDMDATLSHKPVTDVTLGSNIAAAWRSWGRDLAVATGTGTSNKGSSVSSSLGSLGSMEDVPIAPPLPSQPVMLSLPRSMQPRSTGDAYVTPAVIPPMQQPTAAEVGDDSTRAATQTEDAAAADRERLQVKGPDVGTSNQQPASTPGQLAGRGTAAASQPDTDTAIATAAQPPSSPADTSSQNSTALTGPASPTDTASDKEASEGVAAQDAGVLRCSVDLRFDVVMPAPLSVVPGPMLTLAGGLLSRFAVQAMLPGFLELLSVDYGRWATGSGSRSQAAGSLLASAEAASQPQHQEPHQEQEAQEREQQPHQPPQAGTSQDHQAMESAGHTGVAEPHAREDNSPGSPQANGLCVNGHQGHEHSPAGPLPSVAQGVRLGQGSGSSGIPATVPSAPDSTPPI